MKPGTLVKKKYKPGLVADKIGIVLKSNRWQRSDGTYDSPTVQVMWPDGYGTFWTTSDTLEIVSESR
jgi:hypothetical protein